MSEKNVIEVKNLTKDYGYGKGVFNVDLNIKEGEMVGFVGTNGSGKTTLLRAVAGLLPHTGCCLMDKPDGRRGESERAEFVGTRERDNKKRRVRSRRNSLPGP